MNAIPIFALCAASSGLLGCTGDAAVMRAPTVFPRGDVTAHIVVAPDARRCAVVREADPASSYEWAAEIFVDGRGLIVLVLFDEHVKGAGHKNEQRCAYDSEGRLVGCDDYFVCGDPRAEVVCHDPAARLEQTDAVRNTYGDHGELVAQSYLLPATNVLSEGRTKRDDRRYEWKGTFHRAGRVRSKSLLEELDELGHFLVGRPVYGYAFEGTVTDVSGAFTGATNTFDARGHLVRRTLGPYERFDERVEYDREGREVVRRTSNDTLDEVITQRWEGDRLVVAQSQRRRRSETETTEMHATYDSKGRLAQKTVETKPSERPTSVMTTTVEYFCP